MSETLEPQQLPGMVTSGMPQPHPSQLVEAFMLTVYLPVRGADFSETERRSFLCCLCTEGTLLMHLNISVTYLETSSARDLSESVAKVGQLRLLSVSTPYAILRHSISSDIFWRVCEEGSHLLPPSP